MKAADIELHTMNDVTDDDKSPSGATARYDYVDAGTSANHVTNTSTAEYENRGEMVRSAAAAPQRLPSVSSDQCRADDYEEITSPTSSQTSSVDGYSEAVDLGTSPTADRIPSISPNSDVFSVTRRQEHRHRDNPLYVSSADIKSRDKNNHVTSTGACPPRCLLILVLVSVVLATAAAVLAVFAVTMLLTERRGESRVTVIVRNVSENASSELNQDRQHCDTVIQLLRDDVTQLRAQIEKLQVLNSTHEALLDRLDQIETNLNISQSKLSDVRTELTSVNSSLSDRIYNVSKVPGPQGPPGVGNMSACDHGTLQGVSPINTTTETRSTALELIKPGGRQNWVITGVTCTTVHGTEALLVNNTVQYHCVCRGAIASIETNNNRSCVLHYWICPSSS